MKPRMTEGEFLPIWEKLKLYYGDGRGMEVMEIYYGAFAKMGSVDVIDEAAMLVMQGVKGYSRIPDIAEFYPFITGLLSRENASGGGQMPRELRKIMEEEKAVQRDMYFNQMPNAVASWGQRFVNFMWQIAEKWAKGKGELINDAQKALEWFDERQMLETRHDCAPCWVMSLDAYIQTFAEIDNSLAAEMRRLMNMEAMA